MFERLCFFKGNQNNKYKSASQEAKRIKCLLGSRQSKRLCLTTSAMENAAYQQAPAVVPQTMDINKPRQKHQSSTNRLLLKIQKIEEILHTEIAKLQNIIKAQGEVMAAQASAIELHEASIATLCRYLP